MSFEDSKESLRQFIGTQAAQKLTRNEAATRLQLIDHILFKCLDWQPTECAPEDHHRGQYADYVLSAGYPTLVIEAKREAIAFELPSGFDKRTCKLQYFSDHCPDVAAALQQVAEYAHHRGVGLAVATNGHQYIAFIAVRDDGVPPLSGEAFVFSSLNDILGSFNEFWNALSKPGVQSRWLRNQLIESRRQSLPAKLAKRIGGYPGVQRRNPLQTDLQIVSELVLEDLAKAKAINDHFLRECYCDSGALSQYALVSKNILKTRYDALFNTTSTDPAIIPAVDQKGAAGEILAEGLTKRPILLIGDVGVGKSTFINYFTNVYTPELKNHSIILYIDLGSEATLSKDLREYILGAIEHQLYNNYAIDISEAELVRSIYRNEIKRYSVSIDGVRHANNPEEYNISLLRHLSDLVSKREQHLSRALQHLSKNQRRQVIVFIDNADQRSESTQQKAFLVAQELSQTWQLSVFVALRPETYHTSVRTGSLTGYHPKAFTIAPPRIDLVISKRLQFGMRLASGEIASEAMPSNVHVNFNTLLTLLRIFSDSLNTNDSLIEALDNIACGNVRRSLDFVRQFLGSGHVNTAKILKIVEAEGRYVIPLHEFMRAVIYGDSVYYDPDRSPFFNLFDLRYNDPKDHFSAPMLLGMLLSSQHHGSDGDGWLSMAETIAGLQVHGLSAEEIFGAAEVCIKANLINIAGVDVLRWTHINSSRVRINSKGAYHYHRLSRTHYYVDAVVVDTPILDPQARRAILDVEHIGDRLTRAVVFARYLSDCWKQLHNADVLFNWPKEEAALLADIERISRKIGVGT